MPRKVAPVPKGYRTVTPFLSVRGLSRALDFYRRAFVAEVLSVTHAADGETPLQAEVKIGTAVILVAEENPATGDFSPATLGGATARLLVYIAKVDEAFARAVEAGAEIVAPVEDRYWGDRLGVVVDPFGHHWSIASRIENLSEAEVAERRDGPVVEAATVEVSAGVVGLDVTVEPEETPSFQPMPEFPQPAYHTTH